MADTTNAHAKLPPQIAAGALYDTLLQAALRQFFWRAMFETEPIPSESSLGRIAIEPTRDPCALTIRWFGARHTLRVADGEPFTIHEIRLARAVASVLSARYRAIFDPRLIAEREDLFHGAIEDRYVGAFLEGAYTVEQGQSRADRIARAIEVLRVAALSSYENRPISTGVLLLDAETDPIGASHAIPAGARTYTHNLTGIKSFYRLSDGLRTVFLVNRDGLLLDIVDIDRWAREATGVGEPHVPCAEAFHAHAAATLGRGHVCVVLSPSHEIKVFAEGVQCFTFRHARWHLVDIQATYVRWVSAVGDPMLAERLFQTALDLADARVGALFVVVRNPAEAVAELIAPADRLEWPADGRGPDSTVSRRDLLYMLTHRTVMELDGRVLAALGSMDGATVVDRGGRILAAGAILLHPAMALHAGEVEGARTTAALAAARFGPVLKVSQDGVITIHDSDRIWYA
jgi:hypothetical protein